MSLAVAFGALGAHALKNIISETALETWKTAVQYQLIHSLALLIIVTLANKINLEGISTVLVLMTTGFIFFSGSVYLLSLKEVVNLGFFTKILGPITPIGGLLMISSWILLAVKVLRFKS